MTYNDLTPVQAAVLRKEVQKTLRILGPIVRRMEERGFPKDDPVYQKAWAANSAAFSLEYAFQKIEHGTPHFIEHPYGGASRDFRPVPPV